MIVSKTAFTSLPSDWQTWIAENIARACDPQSVADIMVREGHFDRGIACAAIAEASVNRLKARQTALEMPDIDTSSNTVRTADRTIDVLLNLASPRIVLLGNVLSAEECDTLISLCEPRLMTSPVVDDGDGSVRTHVGRTSRGAMIERGETEMIRHIETRLAEIARWPIERGEGIQVQHYQPSNEYQPHFDWFDPELPGPRKHMEHGGQRLATFVLYLSDVESGGGTAFPALGLEVLPKQGNAVFFQNTNSLHVPDRRTLHAGSPVVRGVKTIANKWLRERNY